MVVGEGHVRFAESKNQPSIGQGTGPFQMTSGQGTGRGVSDKGHVILPGDRSVFAKSRKEGSHPSTAGSKGTGPELVVIGEGPGPLRRIQNITALGRPQRWTDQLRSNSKGTKSRRVFILITFSKTPLGLQRGLGGDQGRP